MSPLPPSSCSAVVILNPLMDILKPQSSNTMIGSRYWPLMGGLLHLVQRGGAWDAAPPSPLLAVPNVIAHPSTASVQLHIIRCGTIIIIFAL